MLIDYVIVKVIGFLNKELYYVWWFIFERKFFTVFLIFSLMPYYYNDINYIIFYKIIKIVYKDHVIIIYLFR